MFTNSIRAFLRILPLCALVACGPSELAPPREPVSPALDGVPEFRRERRSSVGAEFRDHFQDGQAEMNGYRFVTSRYGEIRTGELVLIYVTEPHNRRTWIKDDDASGDDRVDVLKLNVSAKFLTGVYPYSVMTSVFAPIDDFGGSRFAPVKITLSVQEWCGHVFHGVWPTDSGYVSEGFSYFASEGEGRERVAAPRDVFYEDALLIQLRELDGPLMTTDELRISIVPALFENRKAHEPLRPVDGTLRRSMVAVDGVEVTEFVLQYGDYTRTFQVARDYPHHLLGWTTSEGERAELISSVRMPYWNLHGNGDEVRRQEFLGPISDR